jgi:cell division protein FtsI (penicillin-binding protein 3)
MSTIPNRPGDTQLNALFVILAFSMLAFTLKAYDLTVASADEHLSRMDWSSRSIVREQGPRGSILDAEGRILAADVELREVFIDPRYLFTNEPELAPAIRAALVGTTSLDPSAFDDWAASDDVDALPRYVKLAEGLTLREAEALLAPLRQSARDCGDDAPALCPVRARSVGTDASHHRVYPLGQLAAPVLGFVNREHQGGAGLEGRMHASLEGGELVVAYQRNTFRAGILDGELPDLADAAGQTLRLTLDARLQATAERALRASLEQFGAEAGVVVASRPDTGAILALASLPSYDPVAFNDGDPSNWQHRAISHVFEPGSTAKVFAFATALEAGVIDYDTSFDCNNGIYVVGGRRKVDRYCRDTITAWEAIRDSSNIGAIGMAMRVSDEDYAASLRRFGFGARHDIGLPAESRGIFPALPWRESTQQTISYGYGISVTPLQLNVATATIANGGVRMAPYLVAERLDGRGNVLETTEPREVERAVSERAARLTTRAMETVVSADGTASQAQIPGFSVAGKTGTAFLVAPTGGYSDEYLSAFTGFVPAEDPIIAITVLVERPDPSIGFYGGAVAAPVFRAVAMDALVLAGRLPEPEPDTDTPESIEVDLAVSRCPPVGDGVPCWWGAWPGTVAREAAARNWTVQVHGTGRVVGQSPGPGQPAPEDGVIRVTLETAASEDVP